MMGEDVKARRMITISSAIFAELKRAGELAYPDEACGILLGTASQESAGVSTGPAYGAGIGETGRKIVRHFLPVSNTAEEKYHRFSIDPEKMLEAGETAALYGEEIIGIFHTHPDVAAVPSEFDRSHALPIFSYVIGSVRRGAWREMRSWEIELSDYQFREEEILQEEKDKG